MPHPTARTARTARPADVLAVAALAAAVPVLTWYAVGDLSVQGTDLDHAYRAPELPAWADAGLVAAALLAAGLAAARLLRPAGLLRRDRRWWGVLLPAAATGLLAGWGVRVATAGVIGANIGAGLVLLVGVPLGGALLLWAVGRAGVLLRRPASTT
ncbi:hypothetical protein [Vallicoccus soli]|nr:hypothetical protein [Vallicoccus soli]